MNFDVRTVSKAIAGVVVGVVTKYFVDHDILIDAQSYSETVNYVITAVLSFAVVWLFPKNKEQ